MNFFRLFMRKKDTSLYTKEERHQLYMLAREVHLREGMEKSRGMCACIHTAQAELFKDSKIQHKKWANINKQNFPEFHKLMPWGKKNFDYWWKFTPQTFQLRIRKFNKLIKRTEP